MRVTLTKKDSRTGKESCNLLTVKALMERIQSPTKADRSNLERYRQAVPFLHGMRAGNEYADRLPLVCPALEYAADGQEVKRYNGIVLLETDGLTGGGEAEQVKAQARLLPQTVAVLTGADGRSVKILTAFSLPDGTLPQARSLYGPFHAHAYRLAVACYQALLPFPVTLKEPLPETRFRLSMDKEAYYNPQATPFCMEQPQAFPGEMTFAESRKRKENPLARLEPGTDTWLSMQRLYEAALSRAIDATDEWKRGNDLRPLLVKLAEECFRADIPEEETVCQTLMHYPDADEFVLRTLIHTLYKECRGTRRSAGLTPEQIMLLRTEEFMERRFEFRLNTVTEEVEYRRRDSIHFHFRPADRRARNSIAMDALKEGIAVWDRDVDRYLGSDRIPAYNPVEDYLWSTGKWDGRDRIRELADCVPCAEREQWRTFFRRWFLGMVAHWRGMDRQHGNSTVPLLVGAQGCRKSTFCRILLPPELRFAYADSLDFRSKRDAELALGRFLLVNLDEFDQIGDRQQGFLKHLLQKPAVRLVHRHKQPHRPAERPVGQPPLHLHRSDRNHPHRHPHRLPPALRPGHAGTQHGRTLLDGRRRRSGTDPGKPPLRAADSGRGGTVQHAPTRPVGQRGKRADPHRNSGTAERPIENPEAEAHGRGRIQSGQADAEIQVLLQTNEQRKTISGHSYLTD